MTKKAFENAIAVTSALGGSTNAVLHLLAMANEAGVELHLDDFNRIAAKVPHIADMKPGGKFHMSDLDRVGGVPVVMKHLLEAGLLHGDVMTVTGKTMAENLAEIDPPPPDGVVVHPLDQPLHSEGGHQRPDRFVGAQGRRRQGRRVDQGADAVRGHGARVRRRGRSNGRDPGRLGRARHGAGDPIRRSEGWPRHARDAGHHRRVERCRSRCRLRPHHRRPVQRRHVGFLHRPRRSRSRRWRPDCVRARRRSDPHRRARADARSAGRRS